MSTPTYKQFFAQEGPLHDWIVEMLCHCEGEYTDHDEGTRAEDRLIRNIISKMRRSISKDEYDAERDPFSAYDEMVNELFKTTFDEVMGDVDVEYNH